MQECSQKVLEMWNGFHKKCYGLIPVFWSSRVVAWGVGRFCCIEILGNGILSLMFCLKIELWSMISRLNSIRKNNYILLCQLSKWAVWWLKYLIQSSNLSFAVFQSLHALLMVAFVSEVWGWPCRWGFLDLAATTVKNQTNQNKLNGKLCCFLSFYL